MSGIPCFYVSVFQRCFTKLLIQGIRLGILCLCLYTTVPESNDVRHFSDFYVHCFLSQMSYNVDNIDSPSMLDKFTRSRLTPSLLQVGTKPAVGWISVTSTGLVGYFIKELYIGYCCGNQSINGVGNQIFCIDTEFINMKGKFFLHGTLCSMPGISGKPLSLLVCIG